MPGQKIFISLSQYKTAYDSFFCGTVQGFPSRNVLKAAFQDSKNVTIQVALQTSVSLMTPPMFCLLPDEKSQDAAVKPFVCEMLWCDFLQGYDIFEAEIPVQDSGLYYFDMRLETADGLRCLCAASDGNAVISSDTGCEKPQLMFYSETYTPPLWMRGGIMYQIFPDRFNRFGDTPFPDGCVRQEWGDTPLYPENPGDDFKNNNFFGGNLDGIAQKLPYLEQLGVSCIYLCPIFRSHSNHRYDTGDYMSVDPLLGGDEALDRLITAARKRGISIILDGVFNHTGDDSRYFNRYASYDSVGAAQSKDSPYRDWYTFESFPDKYSSWWGIKILPSLNKDSPSVRNFICGENGVIRHYLKKGICGWRLDVADELPDSFQREITKAAKTERSDAMVLGEVWEDASDKIAYGVRKQYFEGGELDCVMNYPLKNALINFLKTEDALPLAQTLSKIYSHYPKHVCDVLMNIFGTHDTERILTVLGTDTLDGRNCELAEKKLSETARKKAKKRLCLAYTVISTVYGFPCIYYGDEAGMEGYRDPFNRGTFPWGSEDCELEDFFCLVGRARKRVPAFCDGDFHIVHDSGGMIGYSRENAQSAALVFVNNSESDYLVQLCGEYRDEQNEKIVADSVTVKSYSAIILSRKRINSGES